MEYRYLGSTGLRIGAIALGAQTFGWSIDEKESKEILNHYHDSGGNYLDAADSYNYGESEQILGNWMKERGIRDNIVLGTKVFFPTGKGPNDTGLSRKHIFQSIDESLKRLSTDYVDLYQIHCFDRRTAMDETIRAMDDLVKCGKVRYLGASNVTPSKLQKGLAISQRSGLNGFVALQLEYSLLVRSPEWELLPQCVEESIGVLSWSPLAGGWLSGKYRRGLGLPPDSRAGRGERWDDGESQRGGKRTYDIIDQLVRIGEEIGKPPSQVALNWLLRKEGLTCVLTGARTIAQLKENLGSDDWRLTEEQMKSLDAVSDMGMPYPYDFIAKYTRE
jgi:aryl-alcohol dehydrogenase-like predicted oxidoreductase